MADPGVNGEVASRGPRAPRPARRRAHDRGGGAVFEDPTGRRYGVAAYLQDHGYRIVPVNPKETEVLGERAYPTLRDIPSDLAVDVVDVFRRAEDTPDIARDAVAIGAHVLWLQAGIVNDEAYRIATDAGLEVIMGVCIRATIRRLDTTEG